MAPSMMSQRLKALTSAGIVVRTQEGSGRSCEYRLTEAGQELRPLIMQLGTWGQRWSRSRMSSDDLDASFLMWDIRRNLHLDRLPPQRVVIKFEFPDARRGMRQWWLVADSGEVDLCLDDPGHETDVCVHGSLRAMTQVWMGDLSLARARHDGLLKVSGPGRLLRGIAGWLGASPFADVAPAQLTRSARPEAHSA
jgi:hypothetical protein